MEYSVLFIVVELAVWHRCVVLALCNRVWISMCSELSLSLNYRRFDNYPINRDSLRGFHLQRSTKDLRLHIAFFPFLYVFLFVCFTS